MIDVCQRKTIFEANITFWRSVVPNFALCSFFAEWSFKMCADFEEGVREKLIQETLQNDGGDSESEAEDSTNQNTVSVEADSDSYSPDDLGSSANDIGKLSTKDADSTARDFEGNSEMFSANGDSERPHSASGEEITTC